MSYVVIWDYSHAFYRCWSIALQAPTHYDPHEATVYHFKGVLKTLEKELAKRNIIQYDTIFVEDRKPVRKIGLLPSYRAGRPDRRADKVRVKELLRDSGVQGHWCHSTGNEADDVIATLVKLSSNQQGLFTIIVSGDKDLWQMISQTTSVFHPTKKEFITQAHIAEAFKSVSGGSLHSPIHIPLFKALWGDAGDCVPNAYPRTQKYLLDIVRQSPTGELNEFNQLLKERFETLTPRCKKIILEGETQVRINWSLVKLDENCLLEWD